jgi:hypothetical protein
MQALLPATIKGVGILWELHGDLVEKYGKI